jgi:hypothetical protein
VCWFFSALAERGAPMSPRTGQSNGQAQVMAALDNKVAALDRVSNAIGDMVTLCNGNGAKAERRVSQTPQGLAGRLLALKERGALKP